MAPIVLLSACRRHKRRRSPPPMRPNASCLPASVASTDAWKRQELGSSQWERRLREPEPTPAGDLIHHPSGAASSYPLDPCGREFLNEFQENSHFPLIASSFAANVVVRAVFSFQCSVRRKLVRIRAAAQMGVRSWPENDALARRWPPGCLAAR